jgi:hypothetical protein
MPLLLSRQLEAIRAVAKRPFEFEVPPFDLRSGRHLHASRHAVCFIPIHRVASGALGSA